VRRAQWQAGGGLVEHDEIIAGALHLGEADLHAPIIGASGADQILTVRPGPAPGIDFEYIIHNADGGEVEQCGNGSRCFARYVRDKGLTTKDAIRVHTRAGVIEPVLNPDGRVTVDMGAPVFELADIPFDATGLQARPEGTWQLWPLAQAGQPALEAVAAAVVSMGNPHAVTLVADVDTAPVATVGPLVESHPRFPRRVNVGFLQVVSRSQVRLRVFERGTGETLACGTGACAAVVAGIHLGLLDARVDVQTRGGQLTIEWAGLGQPVRMTGPAVTVFEGQIDVPDHL